ncbi:MAG: hypothetical protein ABI651_06895 [Verrucomicrobiota bacterium]
MLHYLRRARFFNATLRTAICVAIITSISALTVFRARAQQLIYQEGFNNDGEAATPKRYTTVGKDVYEIPRIRSELSNTDQLGPIYWAHNFEVSFAGVPAPTPARRMIMVWDTTIDASTASEDVLKLWESAVKWLLNNKANAKIVVSGGVAAIGVLGDRLTAAGYTLIDDDTNVTEEQVDTQGDLLIHALAGSRGANAKIPLISLISSDLDDLLLGTIGTPAAFEAGQATIVTPSHPAAGGKTGSFPVATGSFNWQLTGDQLPANAIVLANFIRPITPTIASLADLDAMIAGTKSNTTATGTVDIVDFSDASAGDWTADNAVPGGVTGVWGILGTGKLTVSAAGTYGFALGTDDGGRVQIDINKNGFDAADTIIEDLGPHAHTLKFGDANFTAPDTYDFRVLGYNSAGGGDLEVSVATSAGAGKTNLVDSPGEWEVLGTTGAASPVKLQGTLNVTSYVAAGEVDNLSVPLMVLLNGPSDTPPGTVYGGGPFTGFEGTGFFAGAALNKWPYPDGRVDRSLTLAPVNVAGKTNVQVTVALAATFLDFETTDYLDIVAFPNGTSSAEVLLAHYSPPDGNTKYFVDITHANAHRLNLGFQDVTYSVPAGATDLVIEFRAATTWWNEIVAFDNVRITTAGTAPPPPSPLSIKLVGNKVEITFIGVLQSAPTMPGNWTDVSSAPSPYIVTLGQAGAQFFRSHVP